MSYLLVVDDNTVKIISAYMKMAEYTIYQYKFRLMELGISAIEKLEIGRKPFPKMHAIYFLTPIETSVKFLLEDFADKKNP
jgi:syntaxin-binding protein 1